MLCTVIEGPTYEAAEQQIAQAERTSDLIELRLDKFSDLNLGALQKLRRGCSLPVIFTLRGDGSASHIRDLRALLHLQPDYIDLDRNLPELPCHPNVKIIRSYHDYDKTPNDLEQIYQKMALQPATFYKIAVQANSALDLMRLMRWSRKGGGDLIAIAMGMQGQASRILAPLIRSPIVYTNLEGPSNALGQLPASVLLERYRYRALNAQTQLFGLIGDPVDQSLSDRTHNALLAQLNIAARYVKIAVSPSELGPFLNYAKEIGFRGLSVTMPLKEAILPHLDAIDARASAIGAVNTLKLCDGIWRGYNTDGIGALDALEKSGSVRGKRLTLLGSGGAARAIAHEALQRGAFVTLVSRNREKAERVARDLGCDVAEKPLDYEILINATSSPMPIAAELVLPHTHLMDIATLPVETPFLREARQKCCTMTYGYQMFVQQAAEQFALWFGSTTLA